MVITLLCMLLLAALVFYVINLGRQSNERILTQHSADAAANAGAGWIARTFNTVAMNNVGMARLIAMCNVLDSMPLAVSFSYTDQTTLAQAVQDQLSRGVSADWVREALMQHAAEVDAEVQIITPVNQMLNDPSTSQYFDVTQTTFYESATGRGQLWDAMTALDAYSQAAMQNIGVLAQLNAVRGGEVSMVADDPNAAAFMLPILPQVPYVRGHFNDFERPVRFGLLPDEIDDEVTNRGPYDAIFGQRDLVRGRGSGSGSGGEPSYHGNVPVGLPSDSDSGSGSGSVQSGDPTAYRVFGPMSAMLRRFGGVNTTQLRHSRLSQHLSRQANIKLGYLWPGNATGTVVQPDWNNSFTQAVGIAAATPSRIVNTRFVAVEIKSAYPRNHPQFLSPGTWAHVVQPRSRQVSPRTIYTNGWMDPRTWGVTQTDNHIWLDEWTYPDFEDVSIGLDLQTDDNGQPVAHTIYRYDHFMFAGVNVGTTVEVRNPHNFVDRDSMPAPVNLAPGALPDDGLGAPAPLPYLAVAMRNHRSLLWPSRFTGQTPSAEAPRNLAIAGAQVFNDHSRDLWTQMWHAQLAAVTPTQYSQWLSTFESGMNDAAAVPSLDADQLQIILQHLKHVEPLAESMLSH
jgi:hypothetical protein